MARSSLQDVAGLPDPLLSYNFDLIMNGIPGGGNTRAMTVKCMTTALPGMQVEQVTAALHGVEVNYGGRQIWTKTFQATFVETRDATSRGDLRKWMLYCRNNKQNKGTFKTDYAIVGIIMLYDDIPAVIKEVKVINMFPTQIDDVQMDGSQGTLVQVSCTFSYDWTEEE